MTRDELEAMDKPSLMAKGKEMGLSITPAERKGDMIDKILGVAVAPAKAPDAPLPPEGRLSTLDGKPIVGERMFKVTIMATDVENGDVFLGLNGHGMQIQRGKEVLLGESWLNPLKDCVIKTMTKDPETGRVSQMEIMRYPFTAVPA